MHVVDRYSLQDVVLGKGLAVEKGAHVCIQYIGEDHRTVYIATARSRQWTGRIVTEEAGEADAQDKLGQMTEFDRAGVTNLHLAPSTAISSCAAKHLTESLYCSSAATEMRTCACDSHT